MKKKLLALLLLAAGCITDVNAQKKPNVIFVLTDDMGYSDLSCYGNPLIRTPFLDKMANKGVKATGYMVSSPTCTPSRVSLMTGRYPTRSQLNFPIPPGYKIGLPDEDVTIAEMLKGVGYNTCMIGKWHMGDIHPYNLPNAQGFDHYFGMLYSHDYRAPYVATDTTIKIFRDRTPEIYRPQDTSLTGLYTQEAIKYIRTQKKDKPFFLYLAHNMPHLPVDASGKFKGTSPGGLYGDVIEEIDANLALLWEALEKQGLADNTIFIFSSDNGPWIDFPDRMAKDGHTKPWHVGSQGIFRGKKGDTYEGGHRVPFIIYWKNHTPVGKEIPDAFTSMDILPTLAKWANAPLPAGRKIDGEPVDSLLTGKIAHYNHSPIYYVNYGVAEAIRVGDWKFRRGGANGTPTTTELFNLKEDVREKTNLAAQYPEKVKELEALLDKYDGNTPN
ncbi:arylsulfatase A-like enzyme [Chitinophaga dinghuensis]|uniref:Arylsulfatase A-like enzyme n=1 Tax=Chitinophaga dinghuensis TaxID=1539050 RepID=A0A327WDJ8_9BACT|nr:sulfatase-like hydrolase/transferase [Chitinophaga dinghuensis]RAJ87992.1 arylsulfatase A-like enzyme [Chitinophaga dinghuensis]